MIGALKATLLHWLWPRICAHCREDFPKGAAESLCAACRPKLVPNEPPFCARCSAPVKASRTHCLSCSNRLHACLIRAPFLYRGPAVSVVHAFKFRGGKRAAHAAGLWMGGAIGRFPELGAPDALVPVPLHPRRLRERGYDQALLIAEGVSEAIEIPVQQLLVRQRNTSPQRTLGRQQRLSNVDGVFSASPQASGMRLWLIDDVCTTGATLEACGSALREAGAAEVFGYAFARQSVTSALGASSTRGAQVSFQP